MSNARMVLAFACVVVPAACSKAGPDDGLGGSGGSPPGGAGGKGGNAVAGSGGRAGQGMAGWGGWGGKIQGPEDLSCLKALFADCPTEPGTCSSRSLGSAGNFGTTPTKICYAAGTTVLTDADPLCSSTVSQNRYGGKVYKADGSLCYAFERLCECAQAQACETATYTFRDAAGVVVATGQVGATTTLTCANGDACPGLPAPGGAGRGGGYNCQPYLPGFQCVYDGKCQ